MAITTAEKYEAIAILKNEIKIKPGDKIGCILRHVSRSGMSRSISLFTIKKNTLYDISRLACNAIQGNWDKNRYAIRIGGCGMDMGFALVHELSYALWPNGFKCSGKKCPSSDHSNYRGDNAKDCPKFHKSGGYALSHIWL